MLFEGGGKRHVDLAPDCPTLSYMAVALPEK